jgi:hypothetical protein
LVYTQKGGNKFTNLLNVGKFNNYNKLIRKENIYKYLKKLIN